MASFDQLAVVVNGLRLDMAHFIVLLASARFLPARLPDIRSGGRQPENLPTYITVLFQEPVDTPSLRERILLVLHDQNSVVAWTLLMQR